MSASALFLFAALCTAVDPSLERKSTRAPPLTRDMTMRVGPREAFEEEDEEEEAARIVVETHRGVSGKK